MVKIKRGQCKIKKHKKSFELFVEQVKVKDKEYT